MTPATAAHTPHEAMELLSDWSTPMFDAVAENRGEVVQFGGDGLIALFGEPSSAVAAARDMVEVAAQFNCERAVAQQAPVCFGIGLACGAVVVGLASTRQRAAYACIGSPVLRAEQLAAVGSEGGHTNLMDAGAPGSLAELVSVRADDCLVAFALDLAPGRQARGA